MAAARMTVEEIAERLSLGRLTVYRMLKERKLPALRVGNRWIVTRNAYEQWERSCGMRSEKMDPLCQ